VPKNGRYAPSAVSRTATDGLGQRLFRLVGAASWARGCFGDRASSLPGLRRRRVHPGSPSRGGSRAPSAAGGLRYDPDYVGLVRVTMNQFEAARPGELSLFMNGQPVSGADREKLLEQVGGRFTNDPAGERRSRQSPRSALPIASGPRRAVRGSRRTRRSTRSRYRLRLGTARLTVIQRGYAPGRPALLVAGDDAADFALAWDRLYGRSLWLPSEWQPSLADSGSMSRQPYPWMPSPTRPVAPMCRPPLVPAASSWPAGGRETSIARRTTPPRDPLSARTTDRHASGACRPTP
jgi:hypothetical protein